MTLSVVPVTFRQACAFIAQHHRHHKPPRGMVFCFGVEQGGVLVGVATVGRPVARAYQDGYTLEVNRTCTDGARNANSLMYGNAWQVAKRLGYRRLITYTQDGESGASLKGAGWQVVAERQARANWAESSRELRHLRDPDGPGGVQRSLWEAS